MGCPEDLLKLAQDIADLNPLEPAHQACLRRAVSTAYYAIFHLLLSEATANWARPELRAILARCFDHGPMKTASETKISQINSASKQRPSANPANSVTGNLMTVATAFVQAQQRRIDADYNMLKEWTPVEVYTHVASVGEAFKAWNMIRDEAEAQAYLVSLLGNKERRQSELKAAAKG